MSHVLGPCQSGEARSFSSPGHQELSRLCRRLHVIHLIRILDVNVDHIVSEVGVRREAFVAEFRDSFVESVKLHRISGAALAIMCSGGDSSLITAITIWTALPSPRLQ
jgi:hypothetical protein